MKWPEYMRKHSNDASADEIGDRVGVHAATIRRWRSGNDQPDASHVIAFARAYDRPREEALIAAGYLTPDEIDPTHIIEIGAPLPELTDDELLGEVRRRMTVSETTRRQTDDIDRIFDTLTDPSFGNRVEKRGKRA